MLKALIILPGNVLIVMPALLIWLSAGTPLAAALAGPETVRFWLAVIVGAPGLALMGWTIRDFARIGHGTPAPWQPPTRLVVAGVYRYVRNPMITGVCLVLAAETLLLTSIPLASWLVVFMAANTIYVPASEEPGLEARFGDDYRRYAAHVPRWIPRRTPWTGADSA
ncbi:MAG: isoprenylcysteine carboxylmethyltransferase family protein [Rhodospirillales bacterium]|nr:isoprenylcysteine carboxylmethyltransferase family protein [Rhodospirillales bacterium]